MMMLSSKLGKWSRCKYLELNAEMLISCLILIFWSQTQMFLVYSKTKGIGLAGAIVLEVTVYNLYPHSQTQQLIKQRFCSSLLGFLRHGPAAGLIPGFHSPEQTGSSGSPAEKGYWSCLEVWVSNHLLSFTCTRSDTCTMRAQSGARSLSHLSDTLKLILPNYLIWYAIRLKPCAIPGRLSES